ncbi:hypothetical protein SLEP1_g49180 [Rubroshorea leprosula]|uniref:Uncharacterized protein n=1 Tax=Rubroshorea leprosula TaxID=152421 RepID=A0AAV5LYG8_9ROSI|nr:hypothetical protein SLEP1_g49180 [Rubroshorea leprosula]
MHARLPFSDNVCLRGQDNVGDGPLHVVSRAAAAGATTITTAAVVPVVDSGCDDRGPPFFGIYSI